jgi:hypothetical protein
MTVSCIVHSMHAPMLLAEVAVLLGTSFVGDLIVESVPGSLFPFSLSLEAFLPDCALPFLCTYMIYSLKRHKKQAHVHGSHTFLVKVELVLPHKWAHLYNVTRQVSLGEQNICPYCGGLGSWAVEPAWQLRDVGVELLHKLHKLMHTDAVGFL